MRNVDQSDSIMLCSYDYYDWVRRGSDDRDKLV